MYQGTIDHFHNAYPGTQFPRYRSLGEVEMERIRERLVKQLGLPAVDPLTLIREIDKRQELVKGYDAEREDFRLSSVFSNLNITPQKNVYLNWHRYDDVDEMAFTDLDAYLDDIWYPGPDDLDILDSSLSWILSITHYGAIQFLKFI